LGVCWPFTLGLPYGQPVWWLQIAALALWYGSLMACTSQRQVLVHSAVLATVWLSATFWWLFISMHTYGGLAAPLAVLAVLALAGALGLFYVLVGWLVWRCRSLRAGWASLAFAAAWTLAELARGTWFTGFGWGAVGYAHAQGPLAVWAPWVGSYGLAGLAAWFAASLARLPHTTWLHRLCLAAMLGVGWLGLPLWSQSAGSLSVTLLQGNIAQDEKFESSSGVPLALDWYQNQLLRSQSDLVVAPETAIPLLPADLPAHYLERLQQHFTTGRSAALMGIPLGDLETGYTNSVIGLRPQDAAFWRYDKHHLVPFGEFIPPAFRWFTRMMHIPLGDFNRGAIGQAPFQWKGQNLAVHICYEDLFGEELAARFRQEAQAPTIFVNTSNIAWFGDSIAIAQHLQIARLRALEFERPFLRATNTGATVVLDHQGRITAALPRLTQGVLESRVEGRTGTTAYAWWVARWGLLPLWLLALAVLLLAWRRCQPHARMAHPTSP
jgi:apolipoprotein N-acyltransferase